MQIPKLNLALLPPSKFIFQNMPLQFTWRLYFPPPSEIKMGGGQRVLTFREKYTNLENGIGILRKEVGCT